jgi:uncharacterized protein (TIGR03083 family)
MQIAEHIAVLGREGGLFADAVGKAHLDDIVPTCPEWTVRELAHHVGRVHRWAAAIVRDARPEIVPTEEEEEIWGAMPADGALDAWLRDGHGLLVDVLTNAPGDLDCWYFLGAPSPLAFWARRQAHETAVHRADAQGVGGAVDPVGLDFAVDGIDELLLRFFSGRSRRLRNETAVTMAVATTDADATWRIHIGPDGQRSERVYAADRAGDQPGGQAGDQPGGQAGDQPGGQAGDHADCTVRGAASDVYLALWNRLPLTSLEVRGDAAVLDLWRQRALVRWS